MYSILAIHDENAQTHNNHVHVHLVHTQFYVNVHIIHIYMYNVSCVRRTTRQAVFHTHPVDSGALAVVLTRHYLFTNTTSLPTQCGEQLELKLLYNILLLSHEVNTGTLHRYIEALDLHPCACTAHVHVYIAYTCIYIHVYIVYMHNIQTFHMYMYSTCTCIYMYIRIIHACISSELKQHVRTNQGPPVPDSAAPYSHPFELV